MPDTVDASRPRYGYQPGHDTTFYIGQQRYRLLLRAETDSTKPLVAVTEGIVGPFYAEDTATFRLTHRVRGYEGGQTITLLDPTGRQVFRRHLAKADFYNTVGRDIVTVSAPERPCFIGYHAPSQTLVFTIPVGIPDSDVSRNCVLTVGLDGRVRQLTAGSWMGGEGPDCEAQLLADGTVLNCEELRRPNGTSVKLKKPDASLIAALPLTDTTLFTVYRYGHYREFLGADSLKDYEWVAAKHLRNAPNAFVLNTQGQIRQQFRYAGYYEVLDYEVPRRYVWQTHSYYLLDEARGVHVLDKHNPARVTEVRFQQMQRFRNPQRPDEVRFVMETETARFAFYVDPAQPTSLRYQRMEAANNQL
ncbi:hypothetical protein [Solirubrum puertoriconensis]|uniref:hypothetical protein n=1 Tax=Solirubrum puertoriconensis TaxID=1751427 RepID=UPI0013657783|nr:hypothetical protein [Solirubrum puertoriconensis]